MTKILSDEAIETINNNLMSLKSRHSELTSKIFTINDGLKNEKAKEYLFHGVLRRLNTIEHCVENIYSIFPLEREDLLCINELKDVDINLHAFFVNIFGLLDNMAWVVVHEKDMAGSINKKNVGLYLKKTQNFFDDGFKEYLNSERMKNWHDKYLKNYRDALSHRIPLYVPPYSLKPDQKEQREEINQKLQEAIKKGDLDNVAALQIEMDNMGEIAPFFMHSFSEDSKIVKLHAQVITDFGTVEEIVEKFCAMFLKSLS